MSAVTTSPGTGSGPRTAGTRPSTGPAASLRRTWALVRAEAALLLRNKTALFNGIALAPAMVAMFHFVGALDGLVGEDGAGQAGAVGAVAVLALLSFGLMFVVYYNLASAYVARREELVLKRLRTGQCSDAEILAGAATPAVVTLLGQLVLGTVAIAVWIGLAPPVNPVLLVVAVLGGAFVFVTLAAASTAFTRTVESAQLSTLPIMVVALLFSGVTLPLNVLPDPVARVAELTPLHPVVELVRIGLVGTDDDGATLGLVESFGPAARPLLVLAAWCVIGAVLAVRYMRWEPRR